MTVFRKQDLVFAKKCTRTDFLFKKNPLVGLHGIRGAFNDEALHWLANRKLGISEAEYAVLELIESEEVIRNVAEEKVDLGIFALANSGGGGVLSAVEAMGRYNFAVVAMFTMPVNMQLLVRPEITSAEQITQITAHPIAMNMCLNTLEKKFPKLKLNPGTDKLDTALSAQMLARGEIKPNSAVLASRRASEIYGLKILTENVHDDPNNATVFVLIKKNLKTKIDKNPQKR